MEISNKVLKMTLQMLVIVLIFVLINSLYTLYYGKNTSADIAFTGEQISYHDADETEVVIPYGDILSIELLTAPDYGEPTGGAVVNKTRLGAWHSEQLGDYQTHTSTLVEDCLLIKTADTTYAVNYENNETTAQLLEEIQKYL